MHTHALLASQDSSSPPDPRGSEASIYGPAALVVGQELAAHPLVKKALGQLCQLLEAHDYAAALLHVVGQARPIQVALIDASVLDSPFIDRLRKYRHTMKVILVERDDYACGPAMKTVAGAVEEAMGLIKLRKPAAAEAAS
jgi:hypothetical protein